MKRPTLIWTAILIYLGAMILIYQSLRLPPERVVPVVTPLCTDPYTPFTGLQFDYCNRVDRYYNL